MLEKLQSIDKHSHSFVLRNGSGGVFHRVGAAESDVGPASPERARPHPRPALILTANMEPCVVVP